MYFRKALRADSLTLHVAELQDLHSFNHRIHSVMFFEEKHWVFSVFGETCLTLLKKSIYSVIEVS
jgi:hypothetical protein